jgi:hypothetical protein
MNNKKNLIERFAYNKAGTILLHILTHNKKNDSILKHHIDRHIPFQEKNGSTGFSSDAVNDDKIMCLRAGPLSEKYYCRLKCINCDSEISGDDLWQISRLFYEEKSESLNFEKHITGLEEKTEKLIKMHWSFIIIIADQILTKKELKIEEIIDLWDDLPVKE